MMQASRLASVALLALLAACAQPAQRPIPQAIPATPAGAALSGWLHRYNAAPESLSRGHQLWRNNYGTFELLRIDSSSAYSVDAFVRHGLTGAIGKVYVEVDSLPPHAISGVYALPFMQPPLDLATRLSRDDAQLAAGLRAYAAMLGDADVLSGVVALYRNGKPLFEQGIGMARRDPPLPNDLTTRFELASLSKLFTAVAIAQLVEQGRLSFESRLADVLPAYPNRATAARITVLQLLTHTSGLPDFYRNGKIRQVENSIRSLEDYWPAFALDTLWGTPGAAFDYSNSNYIVLGQIVERVSGLSFERYVERFIFSPAGMTDSCYCEAGAPRRATSYSRYTAGFGPSRRAVPDRWTEVPITARRPGAPAGGGISTARDLANFGSALLTNKLIPAATFARMIAPRVSMGGNDHRGYGFEVHDWNGTRFVGHGGNFWGVMSQIDIYPETGHVVVVLSNNDASGGEAVRNWTRRALAGLR